MPGPPTGLPTVANGDSESPTVWQRLSQTFLRPPSPARHPSAEPEHVDVSRMTDDEKRARIVAVDPTERKVGFAAAILGVALALYANVPPMTTKTVVPWTTSPPKGTTCALGLTYAAKTKTCNGIYPPSHYVLPLIVSLVLALAIYITVLIRRRAPLAFTMVMTGLAFGSLFVLLPYGFAGGWVMLRAWRTQKNGSPTARTPLTGWTAPPPRGSTRRAKASAPRSGQRGKGADSTGASRKPPVANKRYTPKSPPKKKATPPKG